MFRKIFYSLLVSLTLAGCAKDTNTINVQPDIALPAKDPGMAAVTVSINGADQRPDQALAKINHDNQLVSLMASRDLRFLLQEVLEKQMSARGYMIGPDAPIALQIIINKLDANVTQGNIRHSITTQADISVIARSKNGNQQIKSYRQTYSREGAFTATNEKIAEAINLTLSDTIKEMAKDTEIHDFIKKSSR